MASTLRWMVMVVLAVGLAAGAPREAAADEVVRMSTNARMRSRPGERAPTIAKLTEGQTVRIVGRQGRWLKVTARGRVGWITRTQVEIVDEPVAARPTQNKKRAAEPPRRKKGWSSLDEDAVGEDTVDEDAEDEEAEAPPPRAKPVAKPAKKPKKIAKKAPPPKRAKKKAPPAAKPTLRAGATVTIEGEVSVRQRPTARADELYTTEGGEEMKVLVVSDDAAWVRVEDADGAKGWVQARAVRLPEPEPEEAEEEWADDDSGAGDDDGDDEAPTRVRRRAKKGQLAWSAHANLGILSKSQQFSSQGSGIRANYGLVNTAPAVMAGARIAKPFGGYTLGAEASYLMTVGGDGIAVEDPAAQMAGTAGEVLAWSANAVEVRGTVGYRLDQKKGYQLVGRVGYHLASVTVDQSDTAKLPSERLSGFTVGVGLEAPRLTPKLAGRVGVELLLGATLEQTEGLRDGEAQSLAGYYLHCGAAYQVKRNLDATASYALALERFGFMGTSEREATASGGSRSDTQHVFTVGASYRF